MQIHELNNFTGTLGSGAYLAIDDGTDTGKISSQGLLAATEARIDNIIAGPAPSAEEIVDARLGADGVTYPSLGDAIRDQFTDVKSALNEAVENEYNPANNTNGYLNPDGTPSATSITSWCWTDKLPVDTTNVFLFYGATATRAAASTTASTLLYDADDNVLYRFPIGATSPSLITIPDEYKDKASYIRFSLRSEDKATFLFLKRKAIYISDVNDIVDGIDSFLYPQTENLFDYSDFEPHYYYDDSGESHYISSDAWGITAKMPINISKTYRYLPISVDYTSGSVRCVYFDANDVFCGYFVPTVGDGKLEPPYNAKTVAFSLRKEDAPTFRLYCIDNLNIDHVTKYDYQQWNGKEWYSFGTSMSDTTCTMPFNLGGVTGRYPFYLSALSGLVHTNFALGGSRIADAATADRDTILQKIQNATITDADLITIEGFVNDWASSIPIGTVTDSTDATLYGALNLAIQSITSRNSLATIIIITDTTGRDWTSPGGVVKDNTNLNYQNQNGLTQNDYNDAVVNYCNKVGIICIDAGRKSEISQYHPQYLADNLHHSQLGAEQFGHTIWDELKNIHPNMKWLSQRQI